MPDLNEGEPVLALSPTGGGLASDADSLGEGFDRQKFRG